MLWRKPLDLLDLVKVIRDPRDATKDYYIPKRRAERLYAKGKLLQIQSEGTGWQYLCDQRTKIM